MLTPLDGQGVPWWLTNIYSPATRPDKAAFLQELRDIRAASPGPWLICGDFNLIYQAADKNNGRLHRGLMRRFRSVIDDLQLDELHLSGHLFTWSSGRDEPTLDWSVLIEPSPPSNGSSNTRTTTSVASPLAAQITRPYC